MDNEQLVKRPAKGVRELGIGRMSCFNKALPSEVANRLRGGYTFRTHVFF